MASQASFDVSTGADLQEVDNAVNQAQKEIIQRYDFKGSKASIAFDRPKATLTLIADDDFKMKALFDVLQSKLVRRGVPVKNLELGPVTPAAGDTVRREIKLTQGIPQEKAKAIVKAIKDKKFKKAQASIQGDEIRVQSPSKDELQEVMAFLRSQDWASSSGSGTTADEAGRRLARLRQGDRRLRAAGRRAGGPRRGGDGRPAARRRDPREHLRLHRRGEAGVDRRHSVGRKPQGARRREGGRGGRMPRPALQARAAAGDPGGRSVSRILRPAPPGAGARRARAHRRPRRPAPRRPAVPR